MNRLNGIRNVKCISVYFLVLSISLLWVSVGAQIVFSDDDERLTYSDINYYYQNQNRNYNFAPLTAPGAAPAPVENNPQQSQEQNADFKIQNENDEALDDDYYDEVANGGRRITDIDKYKRQQGCLCVKHLKDPHCGSDNKIYDNGCYFDCAQRRNPRLLLRKWGPC